MKTQNILISGAGIAGPCLAYWLLQYGFKPTIVEKAPGHRKGGYLIDFWGKGYEVADKMQILPELHRLGYRAKEIQLLDETGNLAGGFDADVLRLGLNDRFLSILRSDLAETIAKKIEGRCEIRFDDDIETLNESESGVEVAFRSGNSELFDLVIGADGQHSRVRSLMFDSEKKAQTRLGYSFAAFSAKGYQPRLEDVYSCYTVPGKQIARFALREDITVFFCIFARDKHDAAAEQFHSKEYVERKIQGVCCESKAILQALKDSDDFYCDEVTQVRLPSWHKGRMALVGDAAYCPSLLAGQGAALAMCGSYILAGELMRSKGVYTAAFERYQSMLFDFMLKKQISAEKIGVWFAPRTSFGLFVRNQSTRLLQFPLLAKAFATSTIADQICLPDYSSDGQRVPQHTHAL